MGDQREDGRAVVLRESYNQQRGKNTLKKQLFLVIIILLLMAACAPIGNKNTSSSSDRKDTLQVTQTATETTIPFPTQTPTTTQTIEPEEHCSVESVQWQTLTLFESDADLLDAEMQAGTFNIDLSSSRELEPLILVMKFHTDCGLGKELFIQVTQADGTIAEGVAEYQPETDVFHVLLPACWTADETGIRLELDEGLQIVTLSGNDYVPPVFKVVSGMGGQDAIVVLRTERLLQEGELFYLQVGDEAYDCVLNEFDLGKNTLVCHLRHMSSGTKVEGELFQGVAGDGLYDFPAGPVSVVLEVSVQSQPENEGESGDGEEGNPEPTQGPTQGPTQAPTIGGPTPHP